MKKILLSLVIFCINLLAQFETVKQFSYEVNPNSAVGQLLNFGQDHLVYFFSTEDSLKMSHSYNGGVTWQYPIGILSANLNTWVEVNKMQNNRIFVSFGPAPKIIYSDDFCATWSAPVSIPTTIPPTFKPKFYELDQIYAGASRGRAVFYSTSVDGIAWSNLVRFYVLPSTANFSTVLNFEQNDFLYAAAFNGETNSSLQLYSSSALDQVGAYQSTIFETDSGKIIKDLYGLKMNNTYWIAYTLESDLEGTPNKDIYFIIGDSSATQWTEPVLFAKSYMRDDLPVLSELPNSPFISFVSNRFSDANDTRIFYGQLSVSEDTAIPPYIKKVDLYSTYNYPVDLMMTAKVKSFSYNQLSKVSLLSVQLYDDGLHNDGLPNDSIFGNTITVPLTQNDQSIDAISEDIYSNSSQEYMGLINPTLLRNDEIYTFANANSRFSIYRSGDIGNYAHSNYPTAFDDRSIVYGGGFFVSGYSDGTMWTNGIARATRVVDYISGSAGGSESILYVVKKSDLPFSQSWQNWSDAVALGAYFYDGNGDGIYNPVDLNSNGIWDPNEDSPDILGDETVWCVYNDGVTAPQRLYTNIEPQGIEIRQTAWTYTNDENLKNIYFVRYSLMNTGTVVSNTDSVYFGFWSDPDVGKPDDNFSGSDSLINSGFCYTVVNDEVFGSNSPAAFQTILQTPWKYVSDNSLYAINYKGDLLGIDTIYGAVNLKTTSFIAYGCGQGPQTAQEARYQLLGRDVTGSLVDPCTWSWGNVYGVDCSTIDGHWMYSGDPIDSIGWLSYYNCDQRTMINTGPFQLEAGKPIDIITTYHFERGNTNLESVILGKEKAIYLLQNLVVSVSDENPENNIVKDYRLYQNYPNPFNPNTTIKYSIPASVISNPDRIGIKSVEGSRVTLKIFDVLGKEVATLVNEEKPAGVYNIEFTDNNLSSGIYFYRLQAGSFVETKKMILLK